MEIVLNSFRYFTVYISTAVNQSAYKILIIKFHLTVSYLFSLTKISKSFCAVDTHRYAIYKDRTSCAYYCCFATTRFPTTSC
jgi:hypothetical protein